MRDTVARICRWLDGMPLSIELAAARVPVLSVGEIAERLERGTGFLRQASRTAPIATARCETPWNGVIGCSSPPSS